MNADNSISFQASLAWEAVPPVYQLKLELQLELHASWRLSSDGMAKERRTHDADVGHVIFVIKDIEGIEMETAHSAIEPCAARCASSPFVHSIESFKDSLAMLYRNSGTVVLNFDNRIAFILSDANPNLAAVGRILHSIVDKVSQGLSQDGSISDNIQVIRSIDLNGLLSLLGEHFEKLHRFVCEIKEIHMRAPQLNSSSVGTRHSEKIVHQLSKAVCLFKHASDRVAVVHHIAVHLQGNFADALYGSQRRLQLMAGVGRESP